MTEPLGERLMSKIVKEGDCWLWLAARNNMGYGQIRIARRTVLAHRTSYELFVGAVPTGLCVLHRCDNPRCINPSHLFLGTMRDNTQDMCKKGRARNGSEGQTHCLRGHPLMGDNLAKTTDGSRRCRECRNTDRRQKRADPKCQEDRI